MNLSHRRPPIQLPDPIPAVPLPPGNDPAVVREWASAAMKAFGLDGWRFEVTGAVRQLGVCRYRRSTIGLSKHLLARNGPAEVRDVLLHEIAHAAVGPGHGHGPVWQEVAERIGARPERCNRTARMPACRWRARCLRCCRVYLRHRLTAACCRRCGPVRGELMWTAAGGKP